MLQASQLSPLTALQVDPSEEDIITTTCTFAMWLQSCGNGNGSILACDKLQLYFLQRQKQTSGPITTSAPEPKRETSKNTANTTAAGRAKHFFGVEPREERREDVMMSLFENFVRSNEASHAAREEHVMRNIGAAQHHASRREESHRSASIDRVTFTPQTPSPSIVTQSPTTAAPTTAQCVPDEVLPMNASIPALDVSAISTSPCDDANDVSAEVGDAVSPAEGNMMESNVDDKGVHDIATLVTPLPPLVETAVGVDSNAKTGLSEPSPPPSYSFSSPCFRAPENAPHSASRSVSQVMSVERRLMIDDTADDVRDVTNANEVPPEEAQLSPLEGKEKTKNMELPPLLLESPGLLNHTSDRERPQSEKRPREDDEEAVLDDECDTDRLHTMRRIEPSALTIVSPPHKEDSEQTSHPHGGQGDVAQVEVPNAGVEGVRPPFLAQTSTIRSPPLSAKATAVKPSGPPVPLPRRVIGSGPQNTQRRAIRSAVGIDSRTPEFSMPQMPPSMRSALDASTTDALSQSSSGGAPITGPTVTRRPGSRPPSPPPPTKQMPPARKRYQPPQA